MHIKLGLINDVINFSWDSDLLSENLIKLFVPWQVDNDDYYHENTSEISVTTSLQGYQVTSPHLPPNFCADERILFSTLEYSITLLALEILKKYTQLHTAVIDLHGAGALIAGDHNSGKTTLVLTAISSGFKALSDEVGIVKNDCCTSVGFPRPFRVLSNTQNLDPPIIPPQLSSFSISDELFYVFFDEYYASETTIKYIFFPVFKPGKTALRKVGEIEALRRIIPLVFNFNRNPDCRLKDIIQIIRNATPIEITFNDHWDAVRTIRDILYEIR